MGLIGGSVLGSLDYGRQSRREESIPFSQLSCIGCCLCDAVRKSSLLIYLEQSKMMSYHTIAWKATFPTSRLFDMVNI